MFHVISKLTSDSLLKPPQVNEKEHKSFTHNKPSANVLYINSLKNNKRQQLIAQERVENTGKLICKCSYFSYKEKDNWKVVCSAA